jgi:non-canonical poly(A) RNA polymerase PAPD5/7
MAIGTDTYRPSYDGCHGAGSMRDRDPPLPPGPPPGLPPNMPPHMYQFGGDSWRPYGSQNDASGATPFSFQGDGVLPQYPQDRSGVGAQVPTSSYAYEQQQRYHNDDRARRRPARDRSRRDRNEVGFRIRGRAEYRKHPPTSERPLLKFERGNTPEQLRGMNDDGKGKRRFLDLDDLSDSSEAAMDVSDDEKESVESTSSGDGDSPNGEEDLDASANGGVRLEKGARKDDRVVGGSTPRWSNPETYTSLPPVEETQRKRKDVVKLIRKARVMTEKTKDPQNSVAANDDFISFDFDDEAPDEGLDSLSDAMPGGQGTPDAPKGPRALRASQPARGHHSRLGVEARDPPGPTGDLPLPSVPSETVSNTEFRSVIQKLERLGKRKRAVDATGETEARAPKRVAGGQRGPMGSVRPEWAPRPSEDPAPWLAQPLERLENPGFRWGPTSGNDCWNRLG